MRVLFIINRMNFRKSSGHGIFMKGVVDTLLQHGHFIDIVCDGEPEENFLEENKINVYYPDKQDRLAYSKHSNLFQFADSFNFEKSINFRTAIVKALTNHVYDLVICNDTESAFVCYQLELYKHMRVTSYAHECQSINSELGAGVFKDCYYNLIEQMMYFPITTLIQTKQNEAKLLPKLPYANPNLYILPYPLTDSNVVHSLGQDGLLYIGRHEDRKNPAMYIKVLADIKEKYGVELKAKVLTRTAHVKKFEADFAAIGHTNYEIKADVVGDEKSKLIQSSKVAFMPYKNESFGIAVLEALRFMPTVVLRNYDWHYNFQGMSNLIVADTKEASDIIWSIYNTCTVDKDKVEAEFETYQINYKAALINLVEEPFDRVKAKQEPRNRLYTYLKENEGKWISLADYFKTQNTKGTIYLTSDIESIYTNQSWYQTLHTNEATYLGIPDITGSLVKQELPTEKESSFFE